MTLEEAKREIKKLSDIQMELFDKTYDRKIYGEARAYEEAGHILDEVDTEPVGNPDKMTLKELAHEMRKIFRFKYLVAYAYPGWEAPYIELYGLKPRFAKNGGLNQWFFMDTTGGDVNFNSKRLACTLNLSEYADADGNIDYSKCIEEVE